MRKNFTAKHAVVFLSALLPVISQAQNVGINTTGATPSVNAILDLNTGNTSNNLGLIVPNVTLGASLATFNPPIANAATAGDKGMMVYNSVATNQPIGYYYWNGATWVSVSGAAATVTAANNGLSLSGTTVQLGGSPLLQNTTVTQNNGTAYSMAFDLGTGAAASTGNNFTVKNNTITYLNLTPAATAADGPLVGIGTTGTAGSLLKVSTAVNTTGTGNGILMLAQGGNGASTGGAVSITAGAGGATGAGGQTTLAGGAGGSTSGQGGAVAITAGSSTVATGSNVNVTASAGNGANMAGGNVALTPGFATGSGANGTIQFKDGHLQTTQTTLLTGGNVACNHCNATSPAFNKNSTDIAGEVSASHVNTVADVITVTFNKAYAVPPIVILSPLANANMWVSNINVNGFQVTVGAGVATNTYVWDYFVIQTQ